MNNINNVMSLMDTSGMLLARNVMASGISKYDFYQFIRNNKLEKKYQNERFLRHT